MTDIGNISSGTINTTYGHATNQTPKKTESNKTDKNNKEKSSAQTSQGQGEAVHVDKDLITQRTSMIIQYFNELQTKANNEHEGLGLNKVSDNAQDEIAASVQNKQTSLNPQVDANGYSDATKNMLFGDNPYDNSATKAHLTEAQDALFIQWAAKQFGEGKNQKTLTALMKKDLGYGTGDNGGKLIKVVQKLLSDHGIKMSTDDLEKQYTSLKSHASEVLKYMDKLEHNGSF